MARLPRIVIPGQPLHVIQRGNNRQATFYAEADYHKYLETLNEAAREHGCLIHAYVLMTNHVHLLVTPLQEQSLSLTMQTVGRKYVRYINGVYRRTGTLWEGRYKSAIIDSDRYLLTCSRYIELNPVRANMVPTPGAYRWSSYRFNACGCRNDYLTPHQCYIELGLSNRERQQAYASLFSDHIDENTLSVIRDGTQQGTVIGGSQFQAEITAMLERRVMKHKHGGDRKSEAFKEISSDLTP